MVALNCCQRSKLCSARDDGRVIYLRRHRGDVDGDYAWLIAFTSFFGHTLIYGVIFSSGVFYDIFRDLFDGSSSMTSLIATLSTAFTFAFSPVPGVLINKYGHRTMTIIGGAVAGSGLIVSAYATNLYYLAASFGVIAGIGFGTAYLSLISIVPVYFDKYRVVALGVAVSGVGVGTFVYPPFIRFLVHSVGPRGSLLITGGVTLNLCVCGALMRQPREAAASGRPEACESSESSAKTESSASTLGLETKKRGKGAAFLGLLNLHLFKNVRFFVLCLNNFLCLFGLGIIYVHLAAYSETRRVTKDAAAMLISTIGVSNFVGRPIFGVLAKLRGRPVAIYAVSLSLGGVVVLFMPLMAGFVGMAALSGAFGFFTASLGPLLPHIIAEFFTVELVPSAYGYLLVFEAAGSLLGPPAAGWLYDVLKYYPPSFYLGGAALSASGMVMLPYAFRPSASSSSERRAVLEMDVEENRKCLAEAT